MYKPNHAKENVAQLDSCCGRDGKPLVTIYRLLDSPLAALAARESLVALVTTGCKGRLVGLCWTQTPLRLKLRFGRGVDRRHQRRRAGRALREESGDWMGKTASDWNKGMFESPHSFSDLES